MKNGGWENTKMLKKYQYEVMLVGCAAFWGMAFPVMKLVGESVDSVSFLAVRFTIAALLLSLIFHKKLSQVHVRMLLPCVGVGLLMALHSWLQVEGLRYTSAANSGFITSMNVMFVPLFMYLLFRKKPTKNILIGLCIIICGFLLISGVVGIFPFSINVTTFNLGDFLTLLCAVFTALYMIVFNRLSVKYDEILVNILHMGGAALGMWVFWFLQPTRTMDFSSVSTVVGTLYCGIFASAAAFLLLAKAQAKLEASKVAVLCSLEPVFATLFATLIWHDPLTVATVVGGLLITIGVIKSSV